jgi:hypothetical protein
MKSEMHFFWSREKSPMLAYVAMANLSYIICLFSELLHHKPGLNILGNSLLDIELGIFFARGLVMAFR